MSSNTQRVVYVGKNWHNLSTSLSLKPYDYLQFCDLRDFCLDGLNLSGVEFFGCRLNGASFQGATLHQTRFISCFSSEHGRPTDFRNCLWQDVLVVDSHLHSLSDQDIWILGRWNNQVANAAWETLSDRNDRRYNASQQLGQLGDPAVSPLLACLLTDQEWDVRSVTLTALGQLRATQFPHHDREILIWMFFSLGDEHSIVRQTARDLVIRLSPPDEVMIPSIDRMTGRANQEKLAGLLAAVELCRLGKEYTRFLNLETLHQILLNPAPEIQSECLHLLGILDDQSTIPWILARLTDPDVGVRVAALSAIQLLSEHPSANYITPLLTDPNEKVRIEALYTLGQIGSFDSSVVKAALSDSSTEVRRLAQFLLEN